MEHLRAPHDLGKQVKIWTDEGHKIFGTLHSFNLSLGKIAVKDAYQMEKRTGDWTKVHFNGLQQFFRDDFRSIEFVSESGHYRRAEGKVLGGVGSKDKLPYFKDNGVVSSYPEHLLNSTETNDKELKQKLQTNGIKTEFYQEPKNGFIKKKYWNNGLTRKLAGSFHTHLKMKAATNQEDDSSGDFIKNETNMPILLPPIQQGLFEKPFSEFEQPFDIVEWNAIMSIERFTIRQLLWKDPKVSPVLQVPKNLYIVDGIDQHFHTAMKHINHQYKIGVSLESEGLGRSGRLCWITISTVKNVYMFDIVSLGDFAFTYGLKAILENRHILKIVHDSRTDSDLLYHNFSVNLVNVFDTMMADLTFLSRYVYDGFLPIHPRSLNHLLMDYLSICHDSLFFPRQRRGLSEIDTGKWTTRPLPPMLIIGAARRSLYLPALQQYCRLAVEYEMTQLTQQLMSINRDVDQAIAIKRSKRQDEEIPKELQPNLNAIRIKRELFHMYRNEQHSSLSATSKMRDPLLSQKGHLKTFAGIRSEMDRSFSAEIEDEKGTTEEVVFNNIGAIDKTIVFSKDCLHHRKQSEEPNFTAIKLYKMENFN